jgi:flagellar secretion chaperone FliS
MQSAGYAQYRAITTQTASPGELLIQLYQAAIKNIGLGRAAIERKDVNTSHRHLMRAQEIVVELQRTLDHERGGEIAQRLDGLYTYMRQRLVAANVQKDAEPLDEVANLLRQLLAAWQAAVRQTARQAS